LLGLVDGLGLAKFLGLTCWASKYGLIFGWADLCELGRAIKEIARLNYYWLVGFNWVEFVGDLGCCKLLTCIEESGLNAVKIGHPIHLIHWDRLL